MPKAKTGDYVKVHYTGKFDDGTVFDSSNNQDPLSFKLGEGSIIPGFEEAVVGMKKGDKKSVNIPPEKAYGAVNEDYIFDIARNKLPEGLKPKPGSNLELGNEDGSKSLVTVIEVGDSILKIDANHPLAGRVLTFDIEVVEVGS